VVPEKVTEEQRKDLSAKLQETLDQRLIDLENLYKQELEEG
jgi:hypothetical protein